MLDGQPSQQREAKSWATKARWGEKLGPIVGLGTEREREVNQGKNGPKWVNDEARDG
jgi:hypothetical protein